MQTVMWKNLITSLLPQSRKQSQAQNSTQQNQGGKRSTDNVHLSYQKNLNCHPLKPKDLASIPTKLALS